MINANEKKYSRLGKYAELWVSGEGALQARVRAGAKGRRQETLSCWRMRPEGKHSSGWQVTAQSWLWKMGQVMSACPQATYRKDGS